VKKRPAVYVRDMLRSIAAIEDYTAVVSREEFLENGLLQDAVIRRLEVLGEAAKRIPEDVRSKHPDVPWKEVSGLRDVLIHQYNDVDLELTWTTVQSRTAELRIMLQRVLEIEGWSGI
jgi:uncharacterized protein with HEPN domain